LKFSRSAKVTPNLLKRFLEWRELPEIADLWNSLHSIWTKTLMVIGLLGTLLLFLFRIIEVFDRYDGDYYDVYGSDNKK
jgi:hypothetical protein